MAIEHQWRPSDSALAAGLESLFETRLDLRKCGLVSRTRFELSSTYPSEVVVWNDWLGRPRQLHCKYSRAPEADGHRRGLRYEAIVYGQVLRRLGLGTLPYYGFFQDPTNGIECLVIEHLASALRISEEHDGLLRAARWLGEFHRQAVDISRLKPYIRSLSREYYTHWASRTVSFARKSPEQFSWIEGIADWYTEHLDQLLTGALTMIHGEYYPGNILIKNECVYPIDWESAAIGAGEIDLAALVEGWPREMHAACTQEYVDSRWNSGPPDGFRESLALSRMYWHFRLLSDSPSWTEGKKKQWRLAEMKREAQSIGIL